MDEIEFRKRVYSHPSAPDHELIDLAEASPELKKILEETQQMEAEIKGVVDSVAVPSDLKDKLLKIPATETETQQQDEDLLLKLSKQPAANSTYFQYFAVAASLVLVVGVAFSLTFNTGPSPAEVAFGNGVIAHLYHESAEIEAISSGANTSLVGAGMIRDAMAPVGTSLLQNVSTESMAVRFAKPCVLVPAYDSAHLIIDSDQGPVSIFVINNNPVSVEYTIRDERFRGVVMPVESGNVIIVGEDNFDLSAIKQLAAENIDWVI